MLAPLWMFLLLAPWNFLDDDVNGDWSGGMVWNMWWEYDANLDILSDGNGVLVVVLFYDGVKIIRESPSIYR